MEKVLEIRSRPMLLRKAALYFVCALLILAGYFSLEWSSTTGETGQVFNDRVIDAFRREYLAVERLPEDERAAAQDALDARDGPFQRALLSFGIPIYGGAYLLMSMDALRLAAGDLYYRTHRRRKGAKVLLRGLELVFTFILLVFIPLVLLNIALQNLETPGTGYYAASLGFLLVSVVMFVFRAYRFAQANQETDMPPVDDTYPDEPISTQAQDA